jgi:two-component system response regulator VanR
MSQTVLVVEDENVTRDILVTWLEEAGYDTCSAGNGLEGLMEAREKSPDLIVADIMIPQMDGYELCNMMRQLSSTPFMFLTGFNTENHKRQGFRMGANKFLTKPLDMDVFLQRVSDFLSKSYPSTPPTIEPSRRIGDPENNQS